MNPAQIATGTKSMPTAWLFRVEVAGFPRTEQTEPIEVYGGHREWWAVLADDRSQAEQLIATKIYPAPALDRQLTAEEASRLGLVAGVPVHVDGW